MNYAYIIWITVSYLLGSFPSGYIFTRLSTQKDIRKVGWRKTSGSNVFRNVGVWQGVFTGVFDVGKGYLSVYLAQRLALPLHVQALCGAAAVVGHNWSFFLKFTGGRGIGTLAGAFWALSPQLVAPAVISLILIALVWNAAIGTIFFLAYSLYLAVQFNQTQTIGVLIAACLVPVFLKRLSPINEISLSQNKAELVLNRLVFDDDKPHGMRIRKILKGKWW